MRVFLENYNGVLDSIEDNLEESGKITHNPHEADIFLLWQDVRGPIQQLAEIAKHQMNKPVIVMQHGRGATRDYGPPNNFKLLADKMLVWGKSEEDRLAKFGIAKQNIEIVGCPHFHRLIKKPRVNPGKNILFAPVISSKEEPENVLVYAELKKWESENLKKTVYANFDNLKKAWGWQEDEYKEVILPDGKKERRLWKRHQRPIVPRWFTYGAGLVNVKLSGVHDQFQYHSPIVNTPQGHPGLIDDLADLLANIDVLVCLEEGTMQLMAAYLGIPTIVIDIFKYKNYGGCQDYDKVEKIKTKACYWTKNLNDLSMLIDRALSNPTEMLEHQKEVCRLEGGSDLEGDFNGRVSRVLESFVQRNQRERIKEAVSI